MDGKDDEILEVDTFQESYVQDEVDDLQEQAEQFIWEINIKQDVDLNEIISFLNTFLNVYTCGIYEFEKEQILKVNPDFEKFLIKKEF